MKKETSFKKIGLDMEWIELIKEAKMIGLSLEEIRLFFVDVKKNV